MPKRIAQRNTEEKRTGMSLRMPTENFDNLKSFAEASGVSMNTLVLDAINHYLAEGHALKQAISDHEEATKNMIESLQKKLDKMLEVQDKMRIVD